MWRFVTLLAQINTEPLPKPVNTSDGTLIVNAINIALVILGSVSVLILVLSGIRYTISRGDPQSINKAKNAILYAIIGLVIAMSAGGIVNFVIKGF